MKFLKGLAITLLSSLLYLSLVALGLAFMLNSTILNPDFVVAEVNKLDVTSLAGEFISEQIPAEGEFMTEVIDDVIADLEPWIKEQASLAIYSGYDYLLGESQSLNLVISLEPMKESLRGSLWQSFQQSLPPELAGLPPAQAEQYFDEFYQEFSQQIPPTFEINESLLGPEVSAQLEQVRQIIGYAQLTYKALIGLILLLILCIILINREVRKTTRGIGISFLTCGVVEYAGIFFIKRFAPTQIAQFDIPSYLRGWLPQFLDNFLAPLEMFSIGLMAGGVALLIVSFVYKRRQPSLSEE